MIKNKTYLDYLRHKVDNQVEYDCRQKLKEAELQNFFMVLSKTVDKVFGTKKSWEKFG